MGRAAVAACLIVQDEAERLPDALASVSFCDQIVVVDSGSRDGTQEIARSFGAEVIEQSWLGFAAQRNVALDHARTPWVLEIDADERVSPLLRSSIERFLAAPGAATVAVCPCRHLFLGRPLGRSAKYPAYRARLFRRDLYRHDERRVVHEGIEPAQRPAVLAGDLEHLLAASLGEAVGDMLRYARLEAKGLGFRPGPRELLAGVVLRPAAKAAYRLTWDGGWRDGWRGALKVALDCCSDALVWLYALRLPKAAGKTPRPSHFGSVRNGPPKVVGVACSANQARAAARWLAGLAAEGCDVALICRGPAPGGVAVTPLARRSPVALARALDSERQLRSVDAVVPFGAAAQLLTRLLPATLAPRLPDLGPQLSAKEAALIAKRLAVRGGAVAPLGTAS
jgi:hypothetical protein